MVAGSGCACMPGDMAVAPWGHNSGQRWAGTPMTMNERQTPVLNRVLDNMAGKPSRPPSGQPSPHAHWIRLCGRSTAFWRAADGAPPQNVRLTCPPTITPPFPMRILHTSDWHLGQHFMGKSHQAEHRALTEWLLTQVQATPWMRCWLRATFSTPAPRPAMRVSCSATSW